MMFKRLERFMLKLSFKSVLVFILMICYSCQSQNEKTAEIYIDELGNVSIHQTLNKDIDTLFLHPKAIIDSTELSLIDTIKFDKGRAKRYLIKNSKSSINYSYKKPKKNKSHYFMLDSVFYFSRNFFAFDNLDASLNLNLDYKFANDFALLYPTQSFSKDAFENQCIIAGQFYSESIKGFQTHRLKRDAKNLNEIINLIDHAHDFYSAIFETTPVKPQIIFTPLVGSLRGKCLGNTIVYKDEVLNSANFDARLIVHEMAHLWWFDNFGAFENHILNEAISEFSALYFLDTLGKKEELYKLLEEKNYITEKYNSFSLVHKEKKSRLENKDLSYQFLPMFLFYVQEYNPSFIKKLAEVFKKHKRQQSNISLNEFIKLVSHFGYASFFEENSILPDVYITATKDSLYINSTQRLTHKVPLELIKEKHKIVDSLDFSKRSKIAMVKNQISKVSIDPNFAGLQNSRLNDVWVSNNELGIYKSSYQLNFESNQKVEAFASQVISYLKGEISLDKLVIDNAKRKNIIPRLEHIKKELFKKESDVYILSDASYNFIKERNNKIEMKVLFYNKEDSESAYIDFEFFMDDDLKMITHVSYQKID